MSQSRYQNKRAALGQISQKFKFVQNVQITPKSSQQYSKKQKSIKFNSNEMSRLEQLKIKYRNVENVNINENRKQTSIQFNKQIEPQFSQIVLSPISQKKGRQQLRNIIKFNNLEIKFNEKSCLKNELQQKFSLCRQKLNQNIQSVNQRIEQNISKVQQKINGLKLRNKNSKLNYSDTIVESRQKQSLIKIQKENSFLRKSNQQTFNQLKQFTKPFQKDRAIYQQINQQYSQDEQNNFKPYRHIRRQEYQGKSQNKMAHQQQKSRYQYAQQLKCVNFIQQMKKKIQMIQAQKKLNISKKLSQSKQIYSSKCVQKEQNDKISSQINDYKNEQHLQKIEKVTLANLTPNLAESQIIQLTDRYTTDRSNNSSQNILNEYNSFKTTLQNYSNAKSKYFYQNQQQHQQKNIHHHKISTNIIEQKQNQQHSVYGSPKHPQILTPTKSRKLQQTRLVENNSLQGDLEQIQPELQRQFVLLVNRIAYQAEIDNKFSTLIFKYSNIITPKKNLKQIIKQKIMAEFKQKRKTFNQNIFDYSQIEIDPLCSLQKIIKQYSQQQVNRLVHQVKTQLTKICDYFTNKLQNQFKQDTIAFLIQELYKCQSLKPNDEINIGHLTSYVNMRTGKNLRNRYFYKFLNRIKRNTNKQNDKILSASIIRKDDLFVSLASK